MKKRNKLIALALAASMVLSFAGCGSTDEVSESGSSETGGSSTVEKPSKAEESSVENEESGLLEWMNYESALPIVKDGYEKKLSIYYGQGSDFGKAEESWLYQYLTDQCNFDLEVTTFTGENRNEIISLAFASGELPDVIIGGGFNTAELIKYGIEEEQIIDIAPYITEEYMPNLYAIYEKYPSYKKAVTDAEGHVWSLGYISDETGAGNLERAFLNYDWMEELGYEAPDTLDEFLDLMRAIKKAGYCEYPIGGSWASETPYFYILNAMGYVGDPGSGFTVCLRDGEVVLPIYDREVFGDFLKIMNEIYTEGLIHPDFYTMDATTTASLLSQGVGFISQAALVYMADFTPYWGAVPLTSDWNDTQTWYSTVGATCGGAVITSACEDPELACRMLDLYFSNDNYNNLYRLAIHGPMSHQEDILYGLEGWEYTGGLMVYHDYEKNKDKYGNSAVYLQQEIQMHNSGQIGWEPWYYNQAEWVMAGRKDWLNLGLSKEELAALRHTDEGMVNNGNIHFNAGIQCSTDGYLELDVIPRIIYFSSEVSERNTEIITAVREYAVQEIAKFVTGARPLTSEELDNYFDTLQELGVEEYLQSYADYYNASKSN